MSELTELQRQIVDLVVAGYNNRAISHTLQMPVRKVTDELTGAYRILGLGGVGSRGKLIYALKNAQGLDVSPCEPGISG